MCMSEVRSSESFLSPFQMQFTHRCVSLSFFALTGLQLPDEEQIVKTLVRRFGGLAALEAIHQQLVQSEQGQAQRQSHHLLQHRQQLRQEQRPNSRLQSLHANMAATLRVPSHAWVAALEHEVAHGAPDSVQAILELLGEVGMPVFLLCCSASNCLVP